MSTTEKKLHAKYSASGSEKWLNCPGSVALSLKVPPLPESAFAREGTDAHTCLEAIMKSAKPRVTAVMLKKQYPDPMVDIVFEVYRRIMDLVPEGAEVLCETEVRLDFVKAGMFGTVDAAIVDLFGDLWVIDLKYGRGRLVLPEENSQMIYYGLGLAHKYNYNFERIRLVIAQPRIIHKDGNFREWVIEPLELRKWADRFHAGVLACEKPNAHFKRGRWCFFCPAQSICPITEDKKYEQAQNDFN